MVRRTSIEFPEIIEPTLDKLEASYGLKNVIAGGILALSRLSAEERETFIAEVNGVKPEDAPRKSLREALEVVKKSVHQPGQPGTVIKVLDSQTQAVVDELRKLLGPEPEKRKKKAKRS